MGVCNFNYDNFDEGIPPGPDLLCQPVCPAILALSLLFPRLLPHALSRCGRRTDSILNETEKNARSTRFGFLVVLALNAGWRPEVLAVDLSWVKLVFGLSAEMLLACYPMVLRLGLCRRA